MSHVGRIDGNKTAVSVRGFSGRFSNKLLVLMDGRTLYTPLYSGVFWDVQDTLLEDIERIEVIRGPAATLWGANGVTGVINIITRRAELTQDTFVSLRAGNQERFASALRSGGELGELGHFRVYGKFTRREENRLKAGGDAGDDFHQARAGFRADLALGALDRLTLSGGLYRGSSGGTVTRVFTTPPFFRDVDGEQDVSGGHVVAHWRRAVAHDSELSILAFADYTRRDETLVGERRATFSVDVQHRFGLDLAGLDHQLVWGVGANTTEDHITSTFDLEFADERERLNLFSAFVQDDIELLDDHLTLTVGARAEHNDYTGMEIQPNVRLAFKPTPRHTLWASASRAVRTPSRVETSGLARGTLGVQPPFAPATDFVPANPAPVPVVTAIIGNEDLQAETFTTFEVGYRTQPTSTLSIDVAAFYSDIENFRDGRFGAVTCQPAGIDAQANPLCVLGAEYLLGTAQAASTATGESYGVELAASWQATDRLRFDAWYAWLDIQLHAEFAGAEGAERLSPTHQASLRTSLTLRHDLDVDLWFRYTDELEASNVDDILTADARIAWRPTAGLTLSIVGQNLLDEQFDEFQSELQDTPRVELRRGVYAQASWRF